jgi:tyrosine-protein kinase Etk/Wzc
MTHAPDTANDEIDLGKLIGTLWRGRYRILLTTLAGAAMGAFVLANTAPTYQADALLQLEERSGALALPSSLTNMLDNDPRSVTEIEILRSRMVLGRAIAEQNLDWRVIPDLVPVAGVMIERYNLPLIGSILPDRYVRAGETIALANLVVPPELVNADLRLQVTGATSYRLTLPDGQELDGTLGEALTLPEIGFSMTLDSLAAAPGRQFTIRQIDERSAINALRSRMSVSEVGRGSGILEVRLTGPHRGETTRALAAIVRAYEAQNVSRSAAEAESSLAFIREQLPQAEATMRAAEAAVNDFRQQQATVDLSLETQTILSQVTGIEAELIELQRREDGLAQRFTPAHPSYRQLLDDRARLEARLETLRAEIGTLPETQRQILNLTRDMELAQRIYTELLTRAQEVEVLRASSIGNVRVVDDASDLRRPVAPRRSLILALSMVLGGMAGIALVLVQQWMRRGVQHPGDLERLGLPVLATVNYTKDGDTTGRRKGRLPIIAVEKPADLAVESLRSLRTGLHFGMLDAATPSLTITSSHPQAGKSFLSVNLGTVMAQAGQKICVVDADLRRGHLRRYFDLPRNAPGLAEVLAGDLPFAEAIRPTPQDNLFFLSTGRYPPNPSELLMRSELSALIKYCAETFDLVIFDAPPVLAVTDPVILGRNTGATIFIARHDETALAEIEASQKTFAAAGMKFSGAVLNGFDPKKAGGKYGYGYGYGYRYAYKTRD